MSLNYHRADEIPAWAATITLNGEAPDFSTDWTFTVCLSRPGETTVTKTVGITGDASGTVTVQWTTGELDIPEGTWRVQLTGTRTTGGAQFTIEDQVQIRSRVLAGP